MSRLPYRLLPYIFILMATLVTGCHKDDDYIYPSLRTDFMDLYINEDHFVEYIQADGETSIFYPRNPLSGDGLKGDTLYRAVGRYSLPDKNGFSSIYSVKLIQAGKPHPRTEGVWPDDPLYIESVYRGGNYLNIIAQPLGQNHMHFYDFIEESIHTDNGHTTVVLSLLHNRNGDRESFPRDAYLSIPLQDYQLQKGDSIYLQANIYRQGKQVWKIAY